MRNSLPPCGLLPDLATFLEREQPLFSLYGHIHESPQVSGRWHNTIGRTTCIQPRQGRDFACVLLDPETATFTRHIDTDRPGY